MHSSDSTKTIVLVTGANQGIGYEIVKKLEQEQPLYEILLGSRNIEKGKAAANALGSRPNIVPIQVDITSDESIRQCVKTIEQKYGRLDILINNAGIGGRELPDDMPAREKWQTILEVNIIGVAMLTDALAPLLDRSSRPSVIMMSSELGSMAWTLDSPFFLPVGAYGASKGALNNLTTNLVRVHPKWKVNACTPGYCATNMNGAFEDPNAKTASDGAVVAVDLCVETGKEDGPNGTFASAGGPMPW